MVVELPTRLWHAHEPFDADHTQRVAEGRARLASSRIAVVGLARNCGPQLEANLGRMRPVLDGCRGWRLHVESNDCSDNTAEVLANFCAQNPQATFHYQTLGREQFTAEFAGRRTIALAEYRAACQRWAAQAAEDCDYVVVVDWDQWGGWSEDGLLAGLGWLVEMQGAFGMASVSLFQYDFGGGAQWAHYDLWALRGVGQSGCYYDTYRNGYGGWGYFWFPPVGAPPVLVSSAFGGLTIYRMGAYLAGEYDGEHDCEHVPFHRSIAKATGQHLYICPAMRCLMNWMAT